jgi:phosphonate transport system permease protein
MALSEDGDPPMTRLSDTQLVILGAAAQRADLSVLPLPETLKLKGGALNKVMDSLRNRGLLSLFRSIPEFVWAFMFVRAVGLGPFPGVLAIGVAYGGMLGKVYSEIFESVNSRPLEALQATGANKLQVFFYGWLPQALPNFVSYTLYRWECAVRASAILGLVGAGGLGQQIEISMRMFNFNEVLTILIMLFFMVAAVDYLSAKVRAML